MHFELQLRLHGCHGKPSLCFLVGRALQLACGRRKVHLPSRQWRTNFFFGIAGPPLPMHYVNHRQQADGFGINSEAVGTPCMHRASLTQQAESRKLVRLVAEELLNI